MCTYITRILTILVCNHESRIQDFWQNETNSYTLTGFSIYYSTSGIFFVFFYLILFLTESREMDDPALLEPVRCF